MPDDTKTTAAGRKRAPEPEPTAEPTIVSGSYKTLTAIKYASTKDGVAKHVGPGKIVKDLSPEDVVMFRKHGSIAPQVKG